MTLASALAQSADMNMNYLLLYVPGGWDVTGCFDPKLGRDNIDAMSGEIGRFSGIDVCVDQSRPAVTAFFERYAENSIVINGLQVRSIAHESCATRILTGTSNELAPDIGMMYAASRQTQSPIPYFVLGNQAYGGQQGQFMARAGTIGQFVRLLGEERSYNRLFLRPSTQFYPSEAEQALIEGYLDTEAARYLPDSASRQVQDFSRMRQNGTVLHSAYAGQDAPGFQLELRGQIDLAIRTLQSGVSRVIQLEHEKDWDTHSNNELRQIVAYEHLFSELAYLIGQLEIAGLWSNTLVQVVSEMSRTPKLNDQDGKDHWPVASSLIMSGALEGGRTIGATDDDMLGLPINLESGLAVSDGVPFTPAAMINGVLNVLGVAAPSRLSAAGTLRLIN